MLGSGVSSEQDSRDIGEGQGEQGRGGRTRTDVIRRWDLCTRTVTFRGTYPQRRMDNPSAPLSGRGYSDLQFLGIRRCAWNYGNDLARHDGAAPLTWSSSLTMTPAPLGHHRPLHCTDGPGHLLNLLSSCVCLLGPEQQEMALSLPGTDFLVHDLSQEKQVEFVTLKPRLLNSLSSFLRDSSREAGVAVGEEGDRPGGPRVR